MFENEKIVENKICKHCNISFEITDKDLEFYEKISPIFDWKKYLIPSPKLCPDCRQQRRLSFRNERKLYKRKCDFSWKDIVSIYSPDKKYKVYDQDIWWIDKWNTLDYWKDFDFNKGFFEQFGELMREVPRIWILNWFSENANYWNHSYYNKNSYSVNSCWYVENCYYCTETWKSFDCIDCYNVFNSSLCYELLDCINCNNCQYIENSNDCFKCFLCKDCDLCKNCIWCKNLKGKEYYIFNKKSNKKDFDEILNNFFYLKNERKEIFKEFENIKLNFPSKSINNLNCEKSYFSNNCSDCENIKYCFDCKDCKNVAFSTRIFFGWAENCYDFDLWWEKSSLVYETHCTWNTYNVLFSNIVWWWSNIFYCDNLLWNSNNCFGCVWLKNQQYCILNKQYTKEEYEKLVPRIIEKMQETLEWWEFFPSSISPFWYNETVANEYFPLESPQSQPFSQREKGVEKDSSFPLKWGGLRGSFNRSFYEAPFPKVEKIITVEMYSNTSLLEDISKIPDDILNWAIECERSWKPFRIIKQELEFYRKHNLPIPRRHPEQRHLDRMKLRNPRKLFDRKCDKCGKEIKTTYSPDRKEIVYCENCYKKEVY